MKTKRIPKDQKKEEHVRNYALLGGALLVALALVLMAGLIGNPLAFAGAEEPYPGPNAVAEEGNPQPDEGEVKLGAAEKEEAITKVEIDQTKFEADTEGTLLDMAEIEMIKLGPTKEATIVPADIGIRKVEIDQSKFERDIEGTLLDMAEINMIKIGPTKEATIVPADIGTRKVEIDQSKFEEGIVKEITPSTFSFSGSVDPGWGRAHGRFVWSAGQVLHIWGMWDPADQVLWVGILDHATGLLYYREFTDGTFSGLWSVPWSSAEWAVAVYNPSPPNTKTIFYHGHLQ